MKLLFFDLEFATSKGGKFKICEFGYVLTSEKFEILKKENIIINPNIPKSEWDFWALKHILTRTINDYNSQPKFDHYYNKLVDLISSADSIFGHTLVSDVKALNDELCRYDLPSINYSYYDTNLIYQLYTNSNESISLKNLLNALEIIGDKNEHNAESDAYNTMLCVKKLSHLYGSINQMLESCSISKDKTENYEIASKKRK